jgi:hypothetical protein
MKSIQGHDHLPLRRQKSKYEGKAGVGAIMLPCSDGTDRTFNANDLIAMAYLY